MTSYLRYKQELKCVLDADDIEWITVKGNHIPIKKGESKEDAIKSFFEKKSGGSEKKVESGKETRKSLALKIAEMVNPDKISKQEYARRMLEGVGALKPYSLGDLKKEYERRKEDKEKAEGSQKSESGSSEQKEFMSKQEYESVKKNVQHILDKAVKSEPKITSDLKSITGIKLVGLDYRLKKEKSAVEKVKRERIEKKEELKGVSDSDIMNDMWDLVRYTQEVKNESFVEEATKTLETLKKKGYKVHQLKNFWRPEVNKGTNPYRGINVKLLSPDGQKVELQFNTANNMKVKEKMHEIYNKQRELDADSKEWKELNEQSLKLTKEFDNPKGIEKLVNND